MTDANATQQYYETAVATIKKNDKGHYTVPTHGLYPFQWNWDSALSAMGMAWFDEDRAWKEIETLFDHQWEDGMVPHIIFHEPNEGYFPGPSVWGTDHMLTPTTGITQPAVVGFALKRLFERAKDLDMAKQRIAALIPKAARWHEWFYKNRDPQKTGLVAVLHPWETGRDNSVDWDDAFERIPTEGVKPFQRRDTQHVNADHRPTEAQYKRYIWLVQHFRSLAWDNSKLHDASPFQIVDPGFNAILVRSCNDLAKLAEEFGLTDIAQQQALLAKQGLEAMSTLWNDEYQQFQCYDRRAGKPVDNASIGGLLPLLIDGLKTEHVAGIVNTIHNLSEQCEYLVPSQSPASSAFDSMRYWRGPIWLIVNYMIADGLDRHGEKTLAQEIVQQSMKLIRLSGFSEYYDPITGVGCGGADFTWTAAMVLEFLHQETA